MLGDLSRLSAGFDPILYFVQILTFVAFIGGVGVIALGPVAGVARQAALVRQAVERRSCCSPR